MYNQPVQQQGKEGILQYSAHIARDRALSISNLATLLAAFRASSLKDEGVNPRTEKQVLYTQATECITDMNTITGT